MKPHHLIRVMLLAILVAYPVSMGPVARFYLPHVIVDDSNPRKMPEVAERADSFWRFYGPVQWCGDHLAPLGVAIDWWVKLWHPWDIFESAPVEHSN